MDFEICSQAPEFWKRLTIEEVCTRITSGGTPSRRRPEFFINGTVPWVKTQELQDGWIRETEEKITEEALISSSAKLLPPNTVMLAMYGATVGQLGILGSSMTCNQACCALIIDKYIADFRYVYYLLRLHREAIKGLATGAAQQNLSAAQIKRFKFAFPDLETQTHIVDVLSALDDKIDINRRINQTLEAMAQAIFKSWFVDFDPVKAKIAAIEQGQDPLRAAMRAISGKTDAELDQMPREHHDQLAATAALFPDAMEESELGEIPKGWNAVPLSKITRLVGGGTPKRSESSYWDGDILWFSVKDAPNDGGVWVVDTEKKITAAGLQKSSTKLLREGTTIISARGTVGKLAIVGKGMAMNQSCYGVVGAEGIGDYFNYFNLKEAVETLKRNTHGAVFDTITQATFETVLCVKPDDSIMRRFDGAVAPLLEGIRSSVLQNRELAELRDTLLPKLLSGEIDMGLAMSIVGDNHE